MGRDNELGRTPIGESKENVFIVLPAFNAAKTLEWTVSLDPAPLQPKHSASS